ncbi:MAG TPA: fibronectin type III domain-containing protein [Candidatus Acidoferrales bacterium]
MKMRRAEAEFRACAGRTRSGVPIIRLFIGICVASLAAGCAAPSEPTTRHAPAPIAVTGLSARQLGTRVYLSFTLPTKTEDHKGFSTPLSLDIYWEFIAASAATPEAAAVEKQNTLVRVPSALMSQYTHEGRVLVPVELNPEDLQGHFGGRTAFVVKTRLSSRRASEASNVAIVRVYPPPAPISDLAATVTQEAVELKWTAVRPQAAPSGLPNANATPAVSYRVYRTEKTAATVNAGNSAVATTSAPSAPLSDLLGESPAASFRDATFEFGHSYAYSVRSVVRYGTSPDGSVESDESNLLALTPKDIFPPAAPQGLVAVPVPATSSGPAGIELSWAISAERDLAGYNIYRSDQDPKSPRRLNQSTLLTPAYRDITVRPGRLYTYTVTAVDRAGNESPASEPVTDGISAAEGESSQ